MRKEKAKKPGKARVLTSNECLQMMKDKQKKKQEEEEKKKKHIEERLQKKL